MSMSKQSSGDAEKPARPKCSRCRHHGIIVPQKGHMKLCPFLRCACWKCFLIGQRTRITALQRQLQRSQTKPQPAERGVRPAKPAAAGNSPTADQGARPSGTFGPRCPLSDGPPERGPTSTSGPVDLRIRASRDREKAAGKGLPFARSEEAPCSPFNGAYFSEFGSMAAVPFIHFPIRMSAHYPSGFTPGPSPLLNVPWFPTVPAGLYSDGLPGPLMVPHWGPPAVHYPPPPEPAPPADGRLVFTLQPSQQPPPYKQTEEQD